MSTNITNLNFLKYFKKSAKEVHVPFQDICCPDKGPYPVGYSSGDVLEFFKDKSWNTVPLGGGGGGDITPAEVITTTGGDQEYTIPVGYMLEFILMDPAEDCDCEVSSEDSLDPGDIILEEPVTAEAGAVWVVNIWAKNGERTIIVSGMPADSNIHFIKRKVIP